MAGYGLGGYGGLEEGWGSVDFAGSSEEAIGDFNVSCRALSEGFSIEFNFSAPAEADAPTWNRDVRVLRKIGEWPLAYDDAAATIVYNNTLPIAQDITFTNAGLAAGEIYYYQLFAQRDDGSWFSDRFTDRCSSYPYDRWGACDYLYNSMPRGFRSHDTTQHLYQYLCILGAIVDNNKTDVEHLLTLMEIDRIHEDFIFMLDKRLGWPTWWETGGLQKRDETKLAVAFYKIKGTAAGYEGILSELADYDVEVLEGWRYVMFSNGLYNSITPDSADPDTLAKADTPEDILKYTSDDDGWHSVGGLAFVLTEIPGISGPLTSAVLKRVNDLVSRDFFLTSYATPRIYAISVTEETYPLSQVEETVIEVLAGTASASSEFSGSFTAADANDGDWSSSRWSPTAPGSDNSWLEIDFGSNKTIERARTKEWSASNIASYKFEYWNGAAWVDIPAASGATIGGETVVTHDFAPILTTKARLFIITTTATPSVYEVAFSGY